MKIFLKNDERITRRQYYNFLGKLSQWNEMYGCEMLVLKFRKSVD